jgi:hypothetical protein
MAKRGRIDMSRVASAALDAALENEHQPRRRLSGMRAVAAGAVIATAARVAIKKAPALPKVPNFSELTDDVRDRLAERGWIEDEEPEELDDEEYEDEPVDEAEEGEPVDEAEEDEPVDEDDEDDEDDEPEDENDDGGPEAADDEWEDEEDDEREVDAEDAAHGDVEDEDVEDEDEGDDEDEEVSRPPSIDIGANGGDGNYVDPVAQPPEPPVSSGGKQRSRKAKAGRS